MRAKILSLRRPSLRIQTDNESLVKCFHGAIAAIRGNKIVVAQIWLTPDMFIQPTYHMERWHLSSPLLFTRSEPKAGHTMATCQQTANCVNKNWPKSGPQIISIPGLDLGQFWPKSKLPNCHHSCGMWAGWLCLVLDIFFVIWVEHNHAFLTSPLYTLANMLNNYNNNNFPPLMDPATDLSTFISIRFKFILVW